LQEPCADPSRAIGPIRPIGLSRTIRQNIHTPLGRTSRIGHGYG